MHYILKKNSYMPIISIDILYGCKPSIDSVSIEYIVLHFNFSLFSCDKMQSANIVFLF